MKKEITIVDVQNHFLKSGNFDFTYIIENIKSFVENNKDSIEKVNIVADILFEQDSESTEDLYYEVENEIKEYLMEKNLEAFEGIRRMEDAFMIDIASFDAEELISYIKEEVEDNDGDTSMFGYEEEEYNTLLNNIPEYTELMESIESEAQEVYEELSTFTDKNIPVELALFYHKLKEEYNIDVNLVIEKEYNYYRTVLDYNSNGYDRSNKQEKFPYYLKMAEIIEDIMDQDFEYLFKNNKQFKAIVRQYKNDTNSSETVEEMLSSFSEIKEEVYESMPGSSAYKILNPKLEQIFIGGGQDECLLEEAISFGINNPDVDIAFNLQCIYGDGDINSRYFEIIDAFKNINLQTNSNNRNKPHGM